MGNKKFAVKSRLKDSVNTVKFVTEYAGFIGKASTDLPLSTKYLGVNKVAESIHPKVQNLIITKITDHNGIAKSFYFKSAERKPLAYFRAGQYLTFRFNIENAVVTRAYSIASSPADALKGEYQITVKKVPDSFIADYILNNWSVGDNVTAYAPEGNLVYEPLRDAKTVVAIAGGSGITPFLSLARAIDDGTEDCNLTLLYGCRNSEEILFKDELDEKAAKNDKINVVYILSDSKEKGYEKGFVDAKLIKKYAPDDKYSIFVCGPGGMYQFLEKEIPKLKLERKYVRFEVFSKGKKQDKKPATYKITVTNKGEKTQISASSNETVLTAFERAGIEVPSRCHTGSCGFCRSKLLSGNVYMPDSEDFRRMADVTFGYIHPCCCYPESDLEIKVN